MKKLKISPSGRTLTYENGEQFFILADTAWDLFLTLDEREAEYYFKTRAAQEFNAVQAVITGTREFDFAGYDGSFSFVQRDGKQMPDTRGEWWNNADRKIALAREYGLYMILLPLWNGHYSDTERTFFVTYEDGYEYGTFLAERYGGYDNILWMLGGDCDVKEHMYDALSGLRDALKQKTDQLVTFHPNGFSTSADKVKFTELDIDTCQSSHGLESNRAYELVRSMRSSGKPYWDSEPHYEHHVSDWEGHHLVWDAADVRMSAYSSLLEGACGITYGNPYVIFFFRSPVVDGCCPFYFGEHPHGDWVSELYAQGAEEAKYMKRLMLSRPFDELTPCPELVLNSREDLTFGNIPAARGKKYAYIYSQMGQDIEADCSVLGGKTILASWFDPRTGVTVPSHMLHPEKALFIPPTRGRGNDMLLILDVID